MAVELKLIKLWITIFPLSGGRAGRASGVIKKPNSRSRRDFRGLTTDLAYRCLVEVGAEERALGQCSPKEVGQVWRRRVMVVTEE